MENHLLFEKISSILLFGHFVAGIILAGGMTHCLVFTLGYCRGDFSKAEAEQKCVNLSMRAYIAVFLIGSILYPAFRINVRTNYFDLEMPWATGLFEIKEHWSAIGLALMIAIFMIRNNFNPEREKDKLWIYLPFIVLVNLVIYYSAISGYYLTKLKSI